MGEIYFLLKINGYRIQPDIKALLDTGSFFNVLGYELSDGHPAFDIGEVIYDSEGAEVLVPGTEEKQTFGTLTFESIIIGGFTIRDPKFTTCTLTKIADEAIIGYPLMQYLGMTIDFKQGKDKAYIDP